MALLVMPRPSSRARENSALRETRQLAATRFAAVDRRLKERRSRRRGMRMALCVRRATKRLAKGNQGRAAPVVVRWAGIQPQFFGSIGLTRSVLRPSRQLLAVSCQVAKSRGLRPSSEPSQPSRSGEQVDTIGARLLSRLAYLCNMRTGGSGSNQRDLGHGVLAPGSCRLKNAQAKERWVRTAPRWWQNDSKANG